MLLLGLLMIGSALAMAGGSAAAGDEARVGLLGGALGLAVAGVLMVYLAWPARRAAPPAGASVADAYVVSARPTGGEAVGNRMLEVTLEVHPAGGVPFQATRTFIADGRLRPGEKLNVSFDPADPTATVKLA